MNPNDAPPMESEIELHVYMTATLLAEALSTFGSAETIKAYDDSFKRGKVQPDGTKPKSAPALITLSESASLAANVTEEQQHLLATLKDQVMGLVKKGDLQPIGYKLPRDSVSLPIVLPMMLFTSGDINWDKSEVTYRDAEFSAVRLLANDVQKLKINKFHRAGSIANEEKKSGKLDFDMLLPERYVTEKEAAIYLGISNRTIQGLRVKGGGPVFEKLGQAIRYKMADLTAWKNRNTK